MIKHSEECWYAFVTKPRHEKKAKQYLHGAGFEVFLPLQCGLNQWKDRKRWVEKPLFPGYIFCRIAFVNRFDVLQQPSMVRVVAINNQPMPVRDDEIQAIKHFLSTDLELKVYEGLLPGDHVRIASGVLMGYEGRILQERGERYFVIYIESICKSVSIRANDVKLEKIDSSETVTENDADL